MINGSRSEYCDGARFVQRSELDLVNQKVYENAIHISALSSEFKAMAASVEDMKKSLNAIANNTHKMGKRLDKLMTIGTALSWTISVIMVPIFGVELLKFFSH